MLDVFDAYLPLARDDQQPGIGLAISGLVDVMRLVARQTARLKELYRWISD